MSVLFVSFVVHQATNVLVSGENSSGDATLHIATFQIIWILATILEDFIFWSLRSCLYFLKLFIDVSRIFFFFSSSVSGMHNQDSRCELQRRSKEASKDVPSRNIRFFFFIFGIRNQDALSPFTAIRWITKYLRQQNAVKITPEIKTCLY